MNWPVSDQGSANEEYWMLYELQHIPVFCFHDISGLIKHFQ